MKRTFPLPFVLLSLALCSTARACSVPVFRYALENWRADPYVVTVFHRGRLTEEQQELLSVLQPVNEDGYPAANIFVRTVDLDDEPGEATQAVWDQHRTDDLPHVVVQVPGKFGAPASDVWSGSLNEENVTALISSPARKAIEQRLLEGTSVVWVFLDSGDAEQDDAAYELLKGEIEKLQLSLQLPEIDPADFAELSVAPEALKLQFSALRVDRNDPAERMLVEMLLSVESDLRDEQFVNEPMAFPVFGRGRALYALLGNGIQPATIEDACRFLVSACQCTVKAQNPGVDLLMPVDWERYVEPAMMMETSLPPLAGLGGFAGDESETPPADAATVEEESASADTERVTSDEVVAPAESTASEESGRTDADLSDADAALLEPRSGETVAATEAPVARDSDSEGGGIMRNTMVVIGLVLAGVVMATLLVMRRP
jgi:hypothetical protein